VAKEQSTRTQILEATIALLKRGGESAVKVGLVADELGIAAPSLYHHFANRSGLIRAAYVEWYWQCLRIDGATPELASVAETQEQYEATLRASIMWSYQASRHDARSVRMAVLGAAQNDPLLASEINSVNRNFLNNVAQSVIYGQKKGWVRSDIDPLALAYWAHGQIIGRVVAEMDDGAVNFAEWDKISIDAMFGVIRKQISPLKRKG
jgi:AcrR family transcriptional regulator